MRNEKDLDVNVHDRTIEKRRGLRPANGKQGILHPRFDYEPQPIDAVVGESESAVFPYIEQLVTVSKKHPWGVLAAIVTAVGSVLVAIGTLAVIVVGGMFSMYGTMRELKVQQATIIEQQMVYTNEIKVLRTYEASVLSRQNFIAGLMSQDMQKRLNEYDRSNPVPSLPPVREPKVIIPDP